MRLRACIPLLFLWKTNFVCSDDRIQNDDIDQQKKQFLFQQWIQSYGAKLNKIQIQSSNVGS